MSTVTRPAYDSHIKARKVGDKAWWFLASGGGMNRLRIHALLFERAKAEEVIKQIAADNPGYEFKIVAIESGRAF